MITVSAAGMNDVFARFQALEDTVQTQAVRLLADKVFADVQDGADAHTKNGQLARSVKIQSIQDGYEIFHDLQHAPYAPFVHWGTRPHDIRPKNKKALRWANDGQFIFAKFVRHPGYAGDAYLVKAAQEAPRHMADILNQLSRSLT